MFCHENPYTTAKNSFYVKYCKENVALRFGKPQVNICNIYDELSKKLRNKSLTYSVKKPAGAEFLIMSLIR
jgi:hypothetical protein